MNPEASDYYELLEVPRHASQHVIKVAYRRLVKSLHPDTHPADPRAESTLKKINAAYHILKNEETRKALSSALTWFPGNSELLRELDRVNAFCRQESKTCSSGPMSTAAPKHP